MSASYSPNHVRLDAPPSVNGRTEYKQFLYFKLLDKMERGVTLHDRWKSCAIQISASINEVLLEPSQLARSQMLTCGLGLRWFKRPSGREAWSSASPRCEIRHPTVPEPAPTTGRRVRWGRSGTGGCRSGWSLPGTRGEGRRGQSESGVATSETEPDPGLPERSSPLRTLLRPHADFHPSCPLTPHLTLHGAGPPWASGTPSV